MTFNPAIPAAADYLAQSQGDIQTNFAQSNIITGVNHVNFDNSLPAGAVVADRGKHHIVAIIDQAAAPGTAANEIALHSLSIGGVSTLYLRKESNGTDIAMSGPDPVAASPGQTFLPGGIIMKWGFIGGINIAGTVVAFAVAFPTNCFNVSATVFGNAARGIAVNNLNVAGFTAYSENNGTVIYWVAIGN